MAAAESETLPALQERCRAVRAEGAAGLEGYERVRKSRYLRHWTDAEGAFRLEARLCPDEGAKVLAALGAPSAADLRLGPAARGGGSPTRPTPPTPWWRWPRATGGGPAGGGAGPGRPCGPGCGATSRTGEVCDIPGIGPIPVATARALADDGVLKVVVTKGVDVVAVAHAGPDGSRPRAHGVGDA